MTLLRAALLVLLLGVLVAVSVAGGHALLDWRDRHDLPDPDCC